VLLSSEYSNTGDADNFEWEIIPDIKLFYLQNYTGRHLVCTVVCRFYRDVDV